LGRCAAAGGFDSTPGRPSSHGTYHGARLALVTRKKARGGEEEVTKPVAIIYYTKNMGGVDRADYHCASYNFGRKSKKWWQKMFFWVFEVAVVNTFFVYNFVQTRKGEKQVNTSLTVEMLGVVKYLYRNRPIKLYLQIRHLAFREGLINQLIGGWKRPVSRKRPKSSDGDITRMSHGRAFSQNHERETPGLCSLQQ